MFSPLQFFVITHKLWSQNTSHTFLPCIFISKWHFTHANAGVHTQADKLAGYSRVASVDGNCIYSFNTNLICWFLRRLVILLWCFPNFMAWVGFPIVIWFVDSTRPDYFKDDWCFCRDCNYIFLLVLYFNLWWKVRHYFVDSQEEVGGHPYLFKC